MTIHRHMITRMLGEPIISVVADAVCNEQKLLFIECYQFRQSRSHFLKKGGKINNRTLYVYIQSVFAFCVALRMNVDTTAVENFRVALRT